MSGKIHIPLHTLSKDEKTLTNTLHSTTFGLWLLNYSDGYILKGVVEPQDLVCLNIQHTYDPKTCTANDTMIRPKQDCETMIFFRDLYATLDENFISAVQYICRSMGSKCHCANIIEKLAVWDMKGFGLKKEQIRKTLISVIYSCLRKVIVGRDVRNIFLPEPLAIFQNGDNDMFYYSQWTYGVAPCIFISKVYRNLLKHGPSTISDWWTFLSCFTMNQIPTKNEMDIIFTKDSEMWKNQFKRYTIWNTTWMPLDDRQESWLNEIERLKYVNQNEKLWTSKNDMYMYLNLADGQPTIELKARLSEDSPNKLRDTKAWNMNVILFYKMQTPKGATLVCPFTDPLFVSNDGLVCIMNSKTVLQVIGVLRSKRSKRFATNDPQNVDLVPTVNKHI